MTEKIYIEGPILLDNSPLELLIDKSKNGNIKLTAVFKGSTGVIKTEAVLPKAELLKYLSFNEGDSIQFPSYDLFGVWRSTPSKLKFAFPPNAGHSVIEVADLDLKDALEKIK